MSGDKSAGQIVGGILGGVVGAIVGGPAGALYGASLGLGIGAVIDPPPGPSFKSPRLGDQAQQVSSYGQPLPRVYGTYQTFGNVFWIQDNKLIEVAQQERTGGKGGGGGATITTYKYFGTFAVSLTDKEIIAVKRIWIAGDKWYDAGSDDLGTIIQSNRSNVAGLYGTEKLQSLGITVGYAATWTLYRGTDNQEPDPLIEADIGVGKTPAYRGTSYIVFNRLPLEKYGNSIMGAQVKVEVVTADNEFTPSIVETYTQAISDSTLISMGGYADKVTLTIGNSTWGDQDNNGLYTLHNLLPGQNGLIDQTLNGSSAALPLIQVRGIFETNGPLFIGGNGGTWIRAGSGIYNFYIYQIPSAQVRLRSSILYVSRGGRVWKLLATTYDGDNDQDRNNGLQDFSHEIAGSNGTFKSFDVLDDVVYCYEQDGLTALDVDDFSNYSQYLPDSSGFPLDVDDCWVIAGDGRLWFYNIDTGTELYLVNSSFTGIEKTYTIPAFSNVVANTGMAFIENGLLIRSGYDTSIGRAKIEYIALNRVIDTTYSLASVLTEEMTLSNLIEESDIDTTLVTDEVRGFRVPGISSVRNNIAPLQIGYPFDLVPSGYQLKIVPRNTETDSNTLVIPIEDLNARDFGSEPGIDLERKRTEDPQLPRKVILRYSDVGRNGDPNEQYSPERLNTEAVNVREIELPLSLTADEAAGVAQNIWNAAWIERFKFTFSLPPTYAELEPTDKIFIQADYATFQMRLESINYKLNGILECESVEDSPAQWVPNAFGDTGVVDPDNIGIPGDSVVVLMDIPLMRDADDIPGFAAAMYGEQAGWPGGGLFKSNDNEQTFDDIQFWTDSATVARARNSLGADDGYLIDRTSTLELEVYSGELDSISEITMLGGQQHWAAYGVDGRWEILLFGSADLQSDGSYLLSTFLRGQKGTEWATELHEDQDYFILLSSQYVIGIASSIEELTVERHYRAVTLGDFVSGAESQTFIYRGINLKPLDGVDVRFELTDDDWTFDFTPRTRYVSAWWNTGIEPADESTELYEADIVGARFTTGVSQYAYDPPDGFTAGIENGTSFDPANTASGITLDSNELTALKTEVADAFKSSLVTDSINTTDGGKYYVEFSIDALNGLRNAFIGIAASGFTTTNYIGQTATSWGWYGQDGRVWNSGAAGTNLGDTYTAADIIMMAIDMDLGYVWFGKNGSWQLGADPSTGSSPHVAGLSGTYFIGITEWRQNDQITGLFEPFGAAPDDVTGVIRTLQSSNPNFTYTQEQSEADLGQVPDAIDVEIYKVSSRLGRGYKLQGSSDATLESND